MYWIETPSRHVHFVAKHIFIFIYCCLYFTDKIFYQNCFVFYHLDFLKFRKLLANHKKHLKFLEHQNRSSNFYCVSWIIKPLRYPFVLLCAEFLRKVRVDCDLPYFMGIIDFKKFFFYYTCYFFDILLIFLRNNKISLTTFEVLRNSYKRKNDA